ncbi:MAG: polysaccharide export protein [Burkholderiales bacterium]|nr:MAG: polysaccharide export protein [Burkholderiales bacterium]
MQSIAEEAMKPWLCLLARSIVIASLAACAGSLSAQPSPARAPSGSASEATQIRLPAAVLDEYKIGNQDLLDISVYGQAELTRTVRVNSQGNVSLPLVGTVMAIGLTSIQLERLIADRLSEQYLQNPQVTVFVKEAISSRFTVEGAVSKPGVFPLQGPTTLLRAIALAGGQGNLGDLTNVKVFRMQTDGKQETLTYDVEKIRVGEAEDPRIMNDDLIVVNRSKTRAAIRDSVFSDILSVFNPFAFIR